MDLLPERSSQSTADGLRARLQVGAITRDRSALYANGITGANSAAVQVADRFHLHVNLREAVIRMLDRHHRDVTAAAAEAASDAQQEADTLAPPDPQPITPMTAAGENGGSPAGGAATVPSPLAPTQAQRSLDRRAKRLAGYE
jgi:hypothetical protein